MTTNTKWTANCAAQLYLEDLFVKNLVNENMRPSQVQNDHPVFHNFSAAVFRVHWNKTKLMYSDNLLSHRGTNVDQIDESTSDSVFSTINEIAGTSASTSAMPSDPKKRKLDSSIESSWGVSIATPAVVRSVYEDPSTKKEMVLVVLQLFPGVNKVDIDIKSEGTGQIMTAKYEWPQVMFDAQTLFSTDGVLDLPLYHPIILSYENSLKEVRKNIDAAPVCTLSVKMPIKINLDPLKWKKEYIKRENGTTSVFLKFEGVGAEYNIRSMDKTLVIE